MWRTARRQCAYREVADKNGKYLLEWGTKGTGPSQFNVVHDIAVDAQHRIYVADRSNNRIQIFDEAGKYLTQWPNIRSPSHMTMTKDGDVWITAGVGNRLAKFDLHGKLLTYWGMYGRFAGGLYDPHTLDVDAAGNLYVAEVFNNRIEKFALFPPATRQPSGAVHPSRSSRR